MSSSFNQDTAVTTNGPKCFISFKQDITGFELPKKFNYPHYYQPHPLTALAAKELQDYLTTQQEWRHDFGLTDNDSPEAIGKMFGVLLVQNSTGEIGYLSAFSGKLADSNHIGRFVPPIYDLLAKESVYQQQNQRINELNQQITALKQSKDISIAEGKLSRLKSNADKALQQFNDIAKKAKLARQSKRSQLEQSKPANYQEQLGLLAKESVAYKVKLKHLKNYWQMEIDNLAQDLSQKLSTIESLKQQRLFLSSELQTRIFEQYQFLNTQLETKSINQLFSAAAHPPPAGTGECAAPKLLQYAFQYQLKPLAFAEFWWGKSPKSAIRQHGNFYPACMGKCQPILMHMLNGLEVEENPLQQINTANLSLEVIYSDQDIVVINKPSELLSVPGKYIKDSAFQRVKALYPHASGPMVVHRLDMSTSGLLLFTLNPTAHKRIHQQFIRREVKKRYVAVITQCIDQQSGTIELPLRGDLYDRPRQLVCFEQGKPASTDWQLISSTESQSRLYLYPKTGRTHQLRVHCAHPQGLNAPIVGDDLYGKAERRLHLHAEQLTIIHPRTQKPITFNCAPDF
ncbi:pseudouridine synthase [Thalassotalea ganghwensis]